MSLFLFTLTLVFYTIHQSLLLASVFWLLGSVILNYWSIHFQFTFPISNHSLDCQGGHLPSSQSVCIHGQVLLSCHSQIRSLVWCGWVPYWWTAVQCQYSRENIHDPIDIKKVEEHTKSHSPPNIYIANIIMLSVASSVYAKDRAGQVMLLVAQGKVMTELYCGEGWKNPCCTTCLCKSWSFPLWFA